MKNIPPNVQALAPPAQNSENTNNPLLAVASSAIVLPVRHKTWKEMVWDWFERSPEARETAQLFGYLAFAFVGWILGTGYLRDLMRWILAPFFDFVFDFILG